MDRVREWRQEKHGQEWLQQLKMPFNTIPGLQLGETLHSNPQADDSIFISTLSLWEFLKHTEVERTPKNLHTPFVQFQQ